MPSSRRAVFGTVYSHVVLLAMLHGKVLAGATWPPHWQQQYHPAVPNSSTNSDISGGLYLHGRWHVIVSCAGGSYSQFSWCHLSTSNLVDYVSHGPLVVSTHDTLGHALMSTGSLVPMPAEPSTIVAFFNNNTLYGVSTDGMRTWTAQPLVLPIPPAPMRSWMGWRDQARPLQSADGTWFMVIGCSEPVTAAVCRYRATDEHRLSSWRYDGLLVTSNSSFFGQPLNMFEVPDFFPLDRPPPRDSPLLELQRHKRAAQRSAGDAGAAAAAAAPHGQTVHVLLTDPLLQPSHHPPVDGWYPHNVEWRTGDWSPNGSHYRLLKHGVMDYGWWYAARTSADVTNCGRRLIWGNIRTDVSQGGALAPAEPFPMFFFTSLPRELTIADDGETLLVRPPLELHSLRASPLASVTSETLRCAAGGAPWYRPLGEAVAAELDVRLNVSSTSGDVASTMERFGVYVYASAPGLEEAAYVWLNWTHVAIDLRNTSQNASIKPAFRTVLAAPFALAGMRDPELTDTTMPHVLSPTEAGAADPTAGAMPASRPWRVVQLHAYLDVSVIELFATDCTCDATATTPADCDCRSSRSESAIAVTAIAFSMRKNATAVGLYTRCSVDAAEGSPRSVEATVRSWTLRSARVTEAPDVGGLDTE